MSLDLGCFAVLEAPDGVQNHFSSARDGSAISTHMQRAGSLRQFLVNIDQRTQIAPQGFLLLPAGFGDAARIEEPAANPTYLVYPDAEDFGGLVAGGGVGFEFLRLKDTSGFDRTGKVAFAHFVFSGEPEPPLLVRFRKLRDELVMFKS